MSSSTTSDSLSKAYRLIEADELAAARAVLEPVLASEPDSVDAWWLYSHAVTDTFAARRALDEVVRLDPHYPGLAELMSQLEVVSPSDMETEPLPATDMVELEPIFDEDEFDDEPVIAPVTPVIEPDLRDSLETSPRRWGGPSGAVGGVGCIVGGGAGLLFQHPGSDGGDDVVAVPSPTVELGIGVVQTEAVTEAPVEVIPPTVEDVGMLPVETEAVMTEEQPVVTEPTAETPAEVEPTESEPVDAATEVTTEPVDAEAAVVGPIEVAMLPPGADFTPLVDAMAEYAVASDDVAEVQTDLGETVVVTVCTSPGANLRQSLPAVMDVIASRAAVVAGDADAIGARLVNCETDRALIFVAVPKAQAVDYAVGNLTAEDFQAAWHPQ